MEPRQRLLDPPRPAPLLQLQAVTQVPRIIMQQSELPQLLEVLPLHQLLRPLQLSPELRPQRWRLLPVEKRTLIAR